MSPAVDTPPAVHTLEKELAELVQSELALERRTDSLGLTNILSLVFAIVALGTAIGAIVLAVSNNDNNGAASTRSASESSGPAMAGGGMTGTRATGAAAPAGVRTVHVRLGEMWVRPQYTSVEAGKVTFAARNVGRVEHELMVERAPIKMDGPGKPNEDAAQGMIEDMEPGASGKMTLKLKPGNYVLFCNVPGHYAAGQHIRFTVTKG